MKTKTVKKPWGCFIQYTLNETCTVKIHTVNKNQALSLQSHKKRDELWVALDGGLKATINRKTIILRPGEKVFIKRGMKHRLSATRKARVLEIAFGFFDENDITRYEDKYGRVNKNKEK